MKNLLILLLGIALVSCSKDDQVKAIDDDLGLQFNLDFKDPKYYFTSSPDANHPVWIGITAYHVDGRLMYQGGDSLKIESFYPDGVYRFEVTLFSVRGEIESPIEYKMSVRGIRDNNVHQLFQNTFVNRDSINTAKSAFMVNKKKNSYIVK